PVSSGRSSRKLLHASFSCTQTPHSMHSETSVPGIFFLSIAPVGHTAAHREQELHFAEFTDLLNKVKRLKNPKKAPVGQILAHQNRFCQNPPAVTSSKRVTVRITP